MRQPGHGRGHQNRTQSVNLALPRALDSFVLKKTKLGHCRVTVQKLHVLLRPCTKPSGHQIFGAARDDELLRCRTERRKGK